MGPMSRVEWSRLAPEELEAVCGVLLLRRFDGATRVKPGQGDQGIDIFVPAGSGKLSVFQVKSFAGSRLGAGHKRQIASSLLRVEHERSGEVADWNLLLPMDPTPGRLTWLAEISTQVNFPTRWRGTDYLDSLAAEFPDVIDYYLHGGRAMVERQYEDLMSFSALAQHVSAPDRTLAPGQTFGTLHATVRAMNASDPHYRFEVRLTEEAPGRTGTRGHVCSVSSDSGDGTVVTIDVIARYAQATDDRPLRFNLQVDCEEGADELVEWLEYGGSFDGTGTIQFIDGLPGGLPAQSGQVQFRASSLSTGSAFELELIVFDANGNRLGTLPLLVDRRSAGQKGVRFGAHDPSGFFSMTGLAHREGGRISINLARDPEALFGKPVRLCIEAVRIADLMQSPNRWGVGWRHGGLLGPHSPLPAEAGSPSVGGFCDLLEDLVTLQDLCRDSLLIPGDLSAEHAEEIAVAARLARGEEVEASFSKLELTLLPGALELPEEGAAMIESDYDCAILGQPVSLGKVRCVVESARVIADEIENDGGRRITLGPGTSSRVRYQRVASPSLTELPPGQSAHELDR